MSVLCLACVVCLCVALCVALFVLLCGVVIGRSLVCLRCSELYVFVVCGWLCFFDCVIWLLLRLRLSFVCVVSC